jgi:hypothetical protein
MKMSLTKLLNLPGVLVEDSKQTKETLILSVKADKKTAVSGAGKPVTVFIKIKDI